MDESASRLRIEIDSVPTELDEIRRRLAQLEIERQTLKMEAPGKDASVKDSGAAKELDRLEREIATLKEQDTALSARWQAEKADLDVVKTFKTTIESKQHELEQAQREMAAIKESIESPGGGAGIGADRGGAMGRPSGAGHH